MKATIEYSEMTPENKAKRTTLATGAGLWGSTHKLIHTTAGYELAGSCARWTDEKYGAICEHRSGTISGTWFKTQAQAHDEFMRLTTPIVEQTA